jgi:hypothetical protein
LWLHAPKNWGVQEAGGEAEVEHGGCSEGRSTEKACVAQARWLTIPGAGQVDDDSRLQDVSIAELVDGCDSVHGEAVGLSQLHQ